jgi:hypothetical protein
MSEKIEAGYQVFISDGDEAFGAVREISPDGLVVDVENANDVLFFVPFDAIKAVHSQKVIFNCERLDAGLRQAIGHAYEAEEPQYR